MSAHTLLGSAAVTASAAVLVAAGGLAGCGGGADEAPVPPPITVSVTHTETATERESASGTATTPAPSASSGTPPPTGAAPPAATAQRSPAEVVTAYFDAINRGDHRAAWELGGSAFASSYDAFVAGFDGLLQDRVEVLATDGDQVTVELEAVQADGASRWFEGTYTVRGGRLVAADIRETSGPATAVPDEPGSGYYDTCGQAHEQGQGPFERGEDPAYRDELDRDQDGTACEWND